MIRILVFILTSLLLFACKTATFYNSENFLQLEIAQSRQIISPDSIHEKNIAPLEFTVSKDSSVFTNFKSSTPQQYNIRKNSPGKVLIQIDKKDEKDKTDEEPVKKISKSKGIRIFIPVVLLLISLAELLTNPIVGLGLIGIASAIILFLLLNTKTFGEPEDNKRPKSKVWQILLSLLVLLAEVAFIIVAPSEILAIIGIVFVVVTLMVLIFAIINNLTHSQPKPNLSKEQKKKSPYNKYALCAGIFFLLFLISMVIALLIFVPYLYIIIYLSFILAFILSIIALINMSKKSEYERGKTLSRIVFIISLLPIIFILSAIGVVYVYDI